jgi:hypothetical protein
MNEKIQEILPMKRVLNTNLFWIELLFFLYYNQQSLCDTFSKVLEGRIRKTIYSLLKFHFMTKNSKLALGILGAVAAGVAIGILIAPEKGKDMRKKIRKTASKWTDEMTHLFERGKDKLTKSDLKGKAEMMKESLS